MTADAQTDLEVVRSLLVGAERAEIAELRERVKRLETQLLEAEQRSVAVSEVLVEAVAQNKRPSGDLGEALRPEIEHAVHVSARDNSTVLADALYPVMGPAIRKMIAGIFTLDSKTSGKTFHVEQVMLIERESGLLLAASGASDGTSTDADVVSGMLDAIRLFVQEAFATDDHDGLRDLRVGDTSVLVEWGPRAVLASVVKGIPTDSYRESASVTLEQIHRDFEGELNEFSGAIEPFVAAEPTLLDLHRAGTPKPQRSSKGLWAAMTVVVVVAILVFALTR